VRSGSEDVAAKYEELGLVEIVKKSTKAKTKSEPAAEETKDADEGADSSSE
jgi:hypothetical protein